MLHKFDQENFNFFKKIWIYFIELFYSTVDRSNLKNTKLITMSTTTFMLQVPYGFGECLMLSIDFY